MALVERLSALAGGWSIKKLHRRIMLSNTYKQSSEDNPVHRLKDAANRLLWRMSPRRLDFEELRDAILFVSGNLDTGMGGKPSPQMLRPDEENQEAAEENQAGGMHVQSVSRPDINRRTLYGFIDRLRLPGVYRTFDFANPDEHTPRRQETTVPQQALFFMNSEFVAEQAGMLAVRPEIITERDPKQRIRALYRRVYGRDPSENEIGHGLRYAVRRQDWARYAHALMMTNEFMFLD